MRPPARLNSRSRGAGKAMPLDSGRHRRRCKQHRAGDPGRFGVGQPLFALLVNEVPLAGAVEHLVVRMIAVATTDRRGGGEVDRTVDSLRSAGR